MDSDNKPLDVIVVGGGPAGTTAALRAAELGARVTLVERGRLGGTCTNDGCAPTRVLARAARLVRDTELFETYGLRPAARDIDLAQLLRRTQQTIYELQEKKQLIEHLERAGVRVLAQAGEATFVDPHTLAVGGERLRADRFIICAGGHARELPVPGGELALSHHDVWTLERVPRRLAIIGAAATGSQLASIFNAFGAQVHLLELAPRILPGEDEAVSAALRDSFIADGIDVRCGIRRVIGLTRSDGGVSIAFEEGQGEQSLEVDAVVASIGWVGNAPALNLEAAGVAHARGYVSVNDHLQTSQPHIFAAGDVTGRVMLVQTAQTDARVAAENAVAGLGSFAATTIVPHGGFTDPEYGSVGLSESDARKRYGDDIDVVTVPYAWVDRAVIDSRADGFCKLIAARQGGRLLGAHVVGEQAVEIVHVAATAMAADMPIDRLADLALAYPTYTAVVGQAARRLVEARSVDWRELAPVA